MQHPTPRRPRRRPGENRERLLVSGIQEFAQRGYRGASTAAIAQAAGVPQPHVYTNFSTKRDLFLACAAQVVDRLIASRYVGTEAGASYSRDGEGAMASSGPVLSLFIFQATAAIAEPDVADELSTLLGRLQSEIGTDAFNGLVLEAVRTLT